MYERAKAFLKRARPIEYLIQSTIQIKDTLWKMAVSASTVSYEPLTAKRTGTSNPTAQRVDRIIELEEKINAKIDELVDIKDEILSVAYQMDDNILCNLVLAYYIKCLPTWEDVADDMHYSYAHVTKTLHPKALKAVEAILDERGYAPDWMPEKSEHPKKS